VIAFLIIVMLRSCLCCSKSCASGNSLPDRVNDPLGRIHDRRVVVVWTQSRRLRTKW